MPELVKIFRDRRYFSWLLEAPKSEREREVEILKSKLDKSNSSFINSFPDKDDSSCVAPCFPSKKYNDIKYQLCLETFDHYFFDQCRILAKEKAESFLTDMEKKNERNIFSMSDEERNLIGTSEVRYPKFGNLTLLEYKDFLFRKYLIDPPPSINLEVGYSVSHISPNSIIGVGILDKPEFSKDILNSIISEFLSLEKEFLPLLYSQELPSKRQRKKYHNISFPYKNYRKYLSKLPSFKSIS